MSDFQFDTQSYTSCEEYGCSHRALGIPFTLDCVDCGSGYEDEEAWARYVIAFREDYDEELVEKALQIQAIKEVFEST